MNRERIAENRIFVGNLDYRVTAGDLREMFSGYGEVVDVYFPRDAKRKPPTIDRQRAENEPVNYGCAFLEFKTREQARAVFGLPDLSDRYERKIYISDARKQP